MITASGGPERVGSSGWFVVPESVIERGRVEALASVPVPGLIALERENRLLHAQELVTRGCSGSSPHEDSSC